METRSKCLDTSKSLAEKVDAVFDAKRVPDDEREAALGLLEPLRIKGSVTLPHYEHSQRASIITEGVADFMHLETKAPFYSGLLHDTGKGLAPIEVLGKTDGWTAEDAAAIEPHVMDSYRLIKGRFDFTAEIILLHHRFQVAGYPAKLPPYLHPYSEGAKVMIKLCGYLLAMVDVYDSLHRVNNRSGQVRELNETEIKVKMLELFPDQRRLISELYGAHIFVC